MPSKQTIIALFFVVLAAVHANQEKSQITVDTTSKLFKTDTSPVFTLTQQEAFSELSYGEIFKPYTVETFGSKVHNMIELSKAFTENSRFQIKAEKNELPTGLEKIGFAAQTVAVYKPNYYVFEEKVLKKAVKVLQKQLNLNEDAVSELENKLMYCNQGYFVERIELEKNGRSFVSGILAAACSDRRNIELLWSFVTFDLKDSLDVTDEPVFVAVGTLGLGKVIPCKYEKHSIKFAFPQNEIRQDQN